MDNQLIWWPSPAKLNLFLHINGRKPNGYHELQSLFQMLDYGDELAFEIRDESDITLAKSIEGVDDEDNLIVRAARLLQQKAEVKQGCHIHLKKVLPMGGGIGGGSSNAATTLVALNFLWDAGLSIDALSELGLQLGADVPIFVHGKTAFAEGVGEIIQPVSLPANVFLVVFPECHVSTGEIFQAPQLPRSTPKITWDAYQFEQTHNDCQSLVCELYPKVANTLQWLLEYAPSRMTGTGACLFALFDRASSAQSVLSDLPEGCSGFIANGVNQSPLYDTLTRLKKARDSK